MTMLNAATANRISAFSIAMTDPAVNPGRAASGLRQIMQSADSAIRRALDDGDRKATVQVCDGYFLDPATRAVDVATQAAVSAQVVKNLQALGYTAGVHNVPYSGGAVPYLTISF